jgi:hypothetical protein
MQQDIIDHEMLAGIQTVKDKIIIMRSSKLVQKPILEYFSKVLLPKCRKICVKSMSAIVVINIKISGPPMEYQLLTFGGLLINVWGPTWDWTAHINYHRLLI